MLLQHRSRASRGGAGGWFLLRKRKDGVEAEAGSAAPLAYFIHGMFLFAHPFFIFLRRIIAMP